MPNTTPLRPTRSRAGKLSIEELLFGNTVIRRRGLQGLDGMERNHLLLVGRDDPGGGTGRRAGNAAGAARVGVGVDVDTEPGAAAADTRADFGRTLNDAGGKDQSV